MYVVYKNCERASVTLIIVSDDYGWEVATEF